MHIEPVTLDGQFIRLKPLSLVHHALLCEIGLDEEIWRWLPQPMRTEEEMWAFIEAAVKAQAEGAALPFATIDKASGKALGSTRFFNIDPTHRRVEIGWTWLGKKWQRTAANTEAKYLMLRHVFEAWRCLRVEFKTDSRNVRSRAALTRIGATEEGTLRKHMLLSDGVWRDSVYFSILDSEWPDVQRRLVERLSR